MEEEQGSWYVKQLFWIGPELFVVTRIGEVKVAGVIKVLPIDVEKVEW